MTATPFTCPTCKGKGWVPKWGGEVACPDCLGKDICPSCGKPLGKLPQGDVCHCPHCRRNLCADK